MNKGKIVQIIGPVVDVEFVGALPAIYNALTIEFTPPGGSKTKLTLEVQQHLGDNWVRAVAMSTTEGLKRGQEVHDVGGPITMPVGEGVMGRVFNVTGDPVDEQGPVIADKYNPIHRSAPALVDQSTSPQLLTTGIKVIDLICPFLKGGKVGAFGGGQGQRCVVKLFYLAPTRGGERRRVSLRHHEFSLLLPQRDESRASPSKKVIG